MMLQHYGQSEQMNKVLDILLKKIHGNILYW
jgi:hypothetical protein